MKSVANKHRILKADLFLFLLLFALTVHAQKSPISQISPRLFGDNAAHWYGIADEKNMINALPEKPRYKPTDIKEIADNILLFQKDNGGWPKNYDMFAILSPEQKRIVERYKGDTNTTFDNGTCYSHIRALNIAFRATGDKKYELGAEAGLKYLLNAQYDNGGWPQYYPLRNNYSRHITYNDGVMEGIMNLLQDIVDGELKFDFINKTLENEILNAYHKGIDCILNTQISDDDVLTAWCQQHDEITLKPAWARSFEPPSITNGESSGIVLFLMRIKHPDERIINAVQSAVKWFEDSKIFDTRVQTVKRDTIITDFRISTTDRVVVHDPSAPPIWTRYYELGTHLPLFCNRDGIVVYSLAEVERERRDGYAWYTYAPQRVLAKYPEWKKKWIEN